MPLIRTQSSRNYTEQEGRILLAIQAIKNQEISTIQEVARLFNIPRTTLRRRLASTINRVETRVNSYKLI
jgi:DNA invertase Pin-like site-specific DNA recombinase